MYHTSSKAVATVAWRVLSILTLQASSICHHLPNSDFQMSTAVVEAIVDSGDSIATAICSHRFSTQKGVDSLVRNIPGHAMQIMCLSLG